MSEFSNDVRAGLSRSPKQLSSKYFYDAKGDAIFVEIMHMPEYYLTDAELEIFQYQSEKIIQSLDFDQSQPFDLIELGAGDGLKTRALLSALQDQSYDFRYMPIDLSSNALTLLERALRSEYPSLDIATQHGDYFGVLSLLHSSTRPKLVLFLGSNLGNMPDDVARDFLSQLGDKLSSDDKLLIGVDQIKSPSVVLPAYDDAQGITRRFNLNLLTRINEELDANFDTSEFDHIATYDESEGVVRSYLVSKKDQTVNIATLDMAVRFDADEQMHTEISRKYSDDVMKSVVSDAQFEMVSKLMDSRSYFADYIYTRI